MNIKTWIAGLIVALSGIFFVSNNVGAALSVLQIPQGGTATGTLPAYGKVLVGNSAGTGYDYVSTSTFGTAGSGAVAPFPGNATTSILSFTNGFISNGSSTQVWSNTGSTTATTLAVPSLTSALLLTNGNGLFAEYTGTSCTNQFVRSLDALGAATCATVGTADVSGLDISDDTNLAVAYPITLTGDTVGFTGTSTWIVGASTSTTSFYAGILQALTARFTNITATSGVTFADGYTQTRGSFSFGATDVNATTTDIFTMQSFENAVTIRSISGIIDCPNGCVTAPSGITVKFWHGLNRAASTSATALFTINPTFTSTTTLQTFNTGFNDATLAAGEILWYQIVAASTTQMSIDFTGVATND